MKTIQSISTLEALGRVRLSESFYMREFLYSEVGNLHGIPNIPDNPDLAIEAGTRLCQDLLEPLQSAFGRIAIRSAYRSKAVNGFCSDRQKAGDGAYKCGSNEYNYAAHIWDERDKDGNMGAMATIVIPRFADLYNAKKANWTELAWWIHDNLPYSSMFFFPKNAAFNLAWRENPKRRIESYTNPMGLLTKAGMVNNAGNHQSEYLNLLPLLNK